MGEVILPVNLGGTLLHALFPLGMEVSATNTLLSELTTIFVMDGEQHFTVAQLTHEHQIGILVEFNSMAWLDSHKKSIAYSRINR